MHLIMKCCAASEVSLEPFLNNPKAIYEAYSAETQGAESRPKAAAPSPGRPFGPAIGLALVRGLFVARQFLG